MLRGRVVAKTVLSALALLAAACAHAPAETFTSEDHLRTRWLPLLEDGTTTRSDVVAALGEPTASFESRRILAYRLLLVEQPGPLLWKELLPAGFMMTLQFGTDARREALARHGAMLVARRESDDRWLLSELNREAEYSLVLVFDGELLRRHRLKRILP